MANTTILHNGSIIAEVNSGQTATLKCAGMQMVGDVVVEVAEQQGGGECSGNHIIEVDSLPTENMDSTAIYRLVEEQKTFEDILLIGEVGGQINSLKASMPYDSYYVETKPESIPPIGAYYIEDEDKIYLFDLENGWMDLSEEFGTRIGIISDSSEASNENVGHYIVLGTKKNGDFYTYSEPEFKELYLNFLGVPLPIGAYGAQNGISVTFHYVDTTPPMEEILPVTDGEMHYYYIEDLNDVYALLDGEWEATGAVIVDEPPTTIDAAAYALVTRAWNRYIAPRGSVKINANGQYDITNKEKAIVYIPDASVIGQWKFNDVIDPDMDCAVNFTYFSQNAEKWVTGDRMYTSGIDLEFYFKYLNEDSGSNNTDFVYCGCATGNEWYNDCSRVVDFGSEPQLVPSEFREWLFANATPYFEVSHTKSYIGFFISGTGYLAEEGMTWAEWCESEYQHYKYYSVNDDGIVCSSNNDYYVYLDGALQYGTDVISDGAKYSVSSNASS